MENDKEHAAMGAVIQALSGLDQDERSRVLDYIAKRFGISIGVPTDVAPVAKTAPFPRQTDSASGAAPTADAPVSRARDIRELKEEKDPKNDSQMAVLVAYYLKTMAPSEERKESLTAADIENYFTQADYPLPAGKNGATDTLKNAKRAGYMESAGRGLYRLNRVGFNLAAYNMPVEATAARKPAKRTKKNKKPTTKKK
jgi:hypothetical protein